MAADGLRWHVQVTIQWTAKQSPVVSSYHLAPLAGREASFPLFFSQAYVGSYFS